MAKKKPNKTKSKPAAKKSARKVVKLVAKKPAAKKGERQRGGPAQGIQQAVGPGGQGAHGVRILDFTHVQSGPTCTQLLAWFGADVIKVERPGVGDITRGQLVDVKGADSLYFTMLNHNKRSITIDSKHPQGMRVLNALIKSCDVLVENFAPGALDRMGPDLGLHPQAQPAHDRRLGQGLRPRSPTRTARSTRNVAQCAGGSASTTGFREGPPLVTGRADRRLGHRPASRARHRLGAVPA
ncbi:MAG: CoA transferase [Pseudolabrys sp.]